MTDTYVRTNDGYRLWIRPRDCMHDTDNVCATCDFDRYYADKYPQAPWNEDR